MSSCATAWPSDVFFIVTERNGALLHKRYISCFGYTNENNTAKKDKIYTYSSEAFTPHTIRSTGSVSIIPETKVTHHVLLLRAEIFPVAPLPEMPKCELVYRLKLNLRVKT